MAIGTYEAPHWGKRGWLAPMTNLPADYDLERRREDARDGLSYNGQLYALPFYVESSMTYYRKDLFEAAGLKMPDQPTYDQIKQFADKLTDKAKGQYGICLRGKAGWGENMAFVSTVVNTFGGRWFDEKWHAAARHRRMAQGGQLLRRPAEERRPSGSQLERLQREPHADVVGQVRDVDRRDGRGRHAYNKAQSQVADKIGFAAAPIAVTPKGSHWLWSWSLAIPKTSKSAGAAAKKFITWATSKEYIELAGEG